MVKISQNLLKLLMISLPHQWYSRILSTVWSIVLQHQIFYHHSISSNGAFIVKISNVLPFKIELCTCHVRDNGRKKRFREINKALFVMLSSLFSFVYDVFDKLLCLNSITLVYMIVRNAIQN